MAEILLSDVVLSKIKDFTPLQRILLTTGGTLQGTLSAYFCKPVSVALVEQHKEDEMVWIRDINLRTPTQTVCHAKSRITTTRDDVRERLEKGALGIGQIMETLGIRPNFELKEVGQDADYFWRIYKLDGLGVAYRIREDFPKKLYLQ